MIIEPFHALCQRHADYVRTMPNVIAADTRGFIAVDKEAKPQGAVMLDHFLPNSCQATFKITNPMCFRYNGLITEACHFAYDICGVNIVYALVRQSKPEVLELDYRMGFSKEYFIPGAYYEDEGIWLLKMRKEDAKFYNPEFNERRVA